MPVGIVSDVLCIFIGGIIGTFGGKRLPDKLKESLPMAFAMAAMAMGITSMVKMRSLPVVILSLLLGVIIGSLCNLEKLMRHFGEWVAGMMMRGGHEEPTARARNLEYFAIAVILFCTGPTGIYGVIQASMTGDNSLLYTKSLLDIFTAAIFAANAGLVICFLAGPVFMVFTTFFLLSGFVAPYITPEMLADFSGCGGLLILATGFRMAEIKMFHVTDMLPALVLVMPLSYIWSLLPL